MDIEEIRSIKSCFSIVIIPNNPLWDMKEAIEASMVIDRATKSMIRGQISPDDLLEMVEPYLDDVDKYIEEVDHNLNEINLGD